MRTRDVCVANEAKWIYLSKLVLVAHRTEGSCIKFKKRCLTTFLVLLCCCLPLIPFLSSKHREWLGWKSFSVVFLPRVWGTIVEDPLLCWYPMLVHICREIVELLTIWMSSIITVLRIFLSLPDVVHEEMEYQTDAFVRIVGHQRQLMNRIQPSMESQSNFTYRIHCCRIQLRLESSERASVRKWRRPIQRKVCSSWEVFRMPISLNWFY